MQGYVNAVFHPECGPVYLNFVFVFVDAGDNRSGITALGHDHGAFLEYGFDCFYKFTLNCNGDHLLFFDVEINLFC